MDLNSRIDARVVTNVDRQMDGHTDILTFVYLCVFQIQKNSHLNTFLAT